MTLLANSPASIDSIQDYLNAPDFACYETGRSIGGAVLQNTGTSSLIAGNFIQVDLDNPRIFTSPPLAKQNAAGFGTVDQSVAIEGGVYAYQFSDFTFDTGFGDNAPKGFLFGGSSVAERLAIFPNESVGSWSSSSNKFFPGETLGARIGHTLLTSQQDQVGPSATHTLTLEVPVALNPDVILVPIQTAAIVGTTVGPNHDGVPGNADAFTHLAVFDRVPTCTVAVTNVSSSGSPHGPSTTTTATSVQNCVGPADVPVLQTVQRQFNLRVTDQTLPAWGYNLPDDVWAQCGIQFRLVNHYNVQMDDFHAQLPGTNTKNEDLNQPFNEMEAAALAAGGHLKDIPLVVVPTFCTFPGAMEQDVADTTAHVACVSGQLQSDKGGVALGLAHELGHSVGDLNDSYANPTTGGCRTGQDDNLMCLGGTSLTADQCTGARAAATNLVNNLKSKGEYFTEVQNTPNIQATYALRPNSFPLRVLQATVGSVRTTTEALSVGNDGALYTRPLKNGVWAIAKAISATGVAPATAAVATGQPTSTQNAAFLVGNDGKVYASTETAGTWQALSPISGASFAPAGAFVTTATKGTQFGVFVIDSNGKLEVIWRNTNGTWAAPLALTPASYAKPGSQFAAGARANGELDLFTIGSDGALRYMFYNLNIWGGPLTLSVTNFAPAGAPLATALDVHGFLNVFVVGNDGALYTKWDATPLWSGPSALSATGTFSTNASVSAVNNGASLNAFAIDKNTTLQGFSNAGTSWTGPTTVAQYAAAPGSQINASAQGTELDVFVVTGTFTSGVSELTNTNGTWSAPLRLP
ncbi:MAG TPA: hypothetical protein VH062_09820 [Polyangiaceae bacterium]|nr:hypothetical protein [Polyangiaceae bacterium]